MTYSFSDRVSTLKPNAIREIFKHAAVPGMISLSAGNPSPEAFPSKEIADISDKIMRENPIGALQYSITEGYMPLRETLKKYMKEKYSIGSDYDELIITSGAQQVMDLTTKSLINEGDVVICEAPSFIGSLNTFRSYNAKLVGVTVDSDGMNMEELEKALAENKNTKFIYTIPNFQNPSGITMSLEKRVKMLELAKKYNVLILEDNPYGDLRFCGEDIPSIKSMDTDGHVVYAGSFSKVISPGMRVGWCVAPKELMTKIIVCKQGEDVHTNIWSQMICNEFMTNYDYEAHLARLRDIYREKAQFTMELLDKYLCPTGITYAKAEGGLFLWCTLPQGVNMKEFCQKSIERMVCVVPGNAFLTDLEADTQSFRINFSTPTNEQLEKGIIALGELAKEYINKD